MTYTVSGGMLNLTHSLENAMVSETVSGTDSDSTAGFML